MENGLINVADPKNKESRKAFMTNTVKDMLVQRIPETPDEYVFKDKKHGGKIMEVSQAFQRAVDQLGFNKGVNDPRQKLTFHSLRHTFASWLALQGETLQVIAELLGHKTIEMTMRYAHLIPDHKRRAVLRLESTHMQRNDQQS